jgi:DNA polymerase/3'-5' exonuclease PolX
MRKKSEIEMERQKTAKIARSLIRLKHSLAADEEINAVLPDTLNEFDAALQSGSLRQLRPTVSDLLDGLE